MTACDSQSTQNHVDFYQGLPAGQRFWAMGAILLGVFLSILDYAIANVALPAISEQLHATRGEAVWVVNAYQLATLSSLLPCAFLGSRMGPGRMARFGLTLFLLACALCAFSPNMFCLALARGLQGVGAGCVMSGNIALIRLIYPHAELGRGIALNGLAVALGAAMGPSLGAFILTVLPWPWIFLLNLPPGAVALFLTFKKLPFFATRSWEPDIWFGVLSAAFAVAGAGLALDMAMHGSWGWSVPCGLFSAVAWVCLLRWERRRKTDILPLGLLRTQAFRMACGVGFLGFVSSNLYIVAMPFLLADRFHFGVGRIGLLVSPWAAGVAGASLFIARMADRFPARILSTFGLCLTAFSFCLLCLLPDHPSAWEIVWPTLLGGIGFGIFQPPNNRAIMVAAPVGHESAASGMLSVSRSAGQTTGALLVAGIFTYLPRAGLWCLGAACIAALCGSFLSSIRGASSRS